ncbi:MAG: cytochrome c3 family protein [Planctomycetota bacterium]
MCPPRDQVSAGSTLALNRRVSNWNTRAAVGAVLAMALAACSAASRYEVLSFFFDGVPDPSAPVQPKVVEPQVRQRTVRPEAAPAVVLHQHAPYAQRQCDQCHESGGEKGGRARGAFSINTMSALKMPVTRLCVSCHEPKPLAFQHAPALLGDCVRCHDPHASRFEHLVLKERTADLCAVCHDADTMPTSAAHAAVADRGCATCHDPHGAEAHFLLRPGIDSALPPAAPPALPPSPPAAAEAPGPAPAPKTGGS